MATSSDESIDAQINVFKRQLQMTATNIVCSVSDAGCRGNGPDIPPVGVLAPGESLVDFWHLGFGTVGSDLWGGDYVAKFSSAVTAGMRMLTPKPVDYNHPAITIILQDMMSVRRMSRLELHDLLFHIQNLTKILGPQSGGMAATILITRVGQALGTPEQFPGLLTDNELRAQYKIGTTGKAVFNTSAAALGGAAGAQAVTRFVMGNASIAKFLPDSVADLVRGISEFSGRAISFTATRFGQGAMFFGGLMLGHGGDEFADRADRARAEMLRRRLPDPASDTPAAKENKR